MAPTSQHMHDIIYIYKMSRKKPQKPTYSPVSNTHYYQWDNCVMMTAPPFFPSIIAQYTTKTTNQSSQASEITPQDYMNNIFLHPTKTLSTRQMPPYQQPTYRNIKYLHQCAFSPTTRTWLQAVKKGHFKTWPGVTVEAIQQYLPKSEATTLGHLDQQRKNIQSTRQSEDDQDTMHTRAWLQAVKKGHFKTWPSVTVEAIQ